MYSCPHILWAGRIMPISIVIFDVLSTKPVPGIVVGMSTCPPYWAPYQPMGKAYHPVLRLTAAETSGSRSIKDKGDATLYSWDGQGCICRVRLTITV